MRLAYIAQSVIPSKAANSVHVMRMCEAFADNGHDVTLFVPDHPARTDDPFALYGLTKQFPIRYIPCFDHRGSRLLYVLSTFLFMRAIKRHLKDVNPELVYTRYLPGCLSAAKMGFPVRYEAHSPVWGSRLEGAMYSRLIRHPKLQKLVVISDALKQIYLRHGGLSESSLLVCHDAAPPSPGPEKAAKWLGRPNTLQVGYVGSLYKGRGIGLIRRLAEARQDVDFHLVGPGGKERRELDGMSNLHLYGYVPHSEVHKFRNSCDVLLSPHQRKVTVHGGGGDISAYTSPLKLFEYMSSGKPIIASALPVLKEVLNESNSILVEPEDEAGWLSALSRLEDEEVRNRIGQKGLADFLENYTWSRRAQMVLEESLA